MGDAGTAGLQELEAVVVEALLEPESPQPIATVTDRTLVIATTFASWIDMKLIIADRSESPLVLPTRARVAFRQCVAYT